MRHLLLFLISLSLSLSYAEEFDKNFIESLPEETREKLLKENLEKEKLRDIEYRKPSSSLRKPDTDSSRFGSKLFSMMQSTFMPLNEPNVDGSYVLDYGDVLELQIIGSESSTTKLSIKRNGTVIIKDVGEINVSGLSLTQAVELIKTKVEVSYVGATAFITLHKIRDIQVVLVGDIYNPGTYTLSGNSNVLHALNVSGGPSNNGSFRRITLSRKNKIIEEIDLYKIYILGESPSSTRLMSGDVIFIHRTINNISVSGGVKRSGQYELLEEENLAQAIEYAQGLSRIADSTDINLERIIEGEIVIQKIAKLSDLNLIQSKPGDRLYIGSLNFINVEINGAVKRPGTYTMNEGDGLFELVNRSGGYRNNAYPLGGIYINQSALASNKKAWKELSKRKTQASQRNKSNSSIPNSTPLESKDSNELDHLFSGRLQAEFDIDVLAKDPSKDVILQNGDQAIIPQFINQVFVYGEVSSEGITKFIPGKNINYYLNLRGNILKSADKKGIIIMHPNGQISPVVYKRWLFQTFQHNVIYPGSIILVPEELETTTSKRLLLVQAYATIVSNIGISLASLNILAD